MLELGRYNQYIWCKGNLQVCYPFRVYAVVNGRWKEWIKAFVYILISKRSKIQDSEIFTCVVVTDS